MPWLPDIMPFRKFNKSNQSELWEGLDKNKDQSYFLARLTNDQLSYARFPLGDTKNPKLGKLAKASDFSVANKKDSQVSAFWEK